MPPALPPPAPTATLSRDAVLDRLLTDILGGAVPPGVRLPAERDLAQRLGASRPTLREALRRLGEWRLVEAKRGSGVVVRPASDWSLAVLPEWLRRGSAARGGPIELRHLVTDLLAVRRELFLAVLRVIAPHVAAPGRLDGARALAQRAWASRGDAGAFVGYDFGIIRAVVEAANFLPALWLMNDLANVYLELASRLASGVGPPDDYLASYDRTLALLEAGHPKEACALLDAYLVRHDDRLLATLGAATLGAATLGAATTPTPTPTPSRTPSPTPTGRAATR